jgi:hypothetical protein
MVAVPILEAPVFLRKRVIEEYELEKFKEKVKFLLSEERKI